jgi:CobQ-like glutamine amidotransferase family enzyme
MIKILHLYYDLLNLYGENANTKALVNRLEKQKEKVKVDFKSVGDDIKINDYDFIYVGSGSLESMKIAKNDFKRLVKDIKKYIKDNKIILATGNSLELFEGILDYKTQEIGFRIVGDQVFECDLIKKLVIGFQNRTSVIYDNNEESLFKVKSGCGYDPNSTLEGIKHNNFYGTYLLGPLLIRNPYFLEYLVKNILENNSIEYKHVNQDVSYAAYEEYLENFVYNKK